VTTKLNDGFRVIAQEETKLVRASAVLFDFNAASWVRHGVADYVTLERQVVPVYEGEVQVGAATLFVTNGQVVALIGFDYATPERLDLQLGTPVFAVPRGDFYLRPSDLVVDYVEISGIDLFYTPPTHAGIGGPLTVTLYDTENS
jgi:hypothetical protein